MSVVSALWARAVRGRVPFCALALVVSAPLACHAGSADVAGSLALVEHVDSPSLESRALPIVEPLVPSSVPSSVRSLVHAYLWRQASPPIQVWRLGIINGGSPRRERFDARSASAQPWPNLDARRGTWTFRSLVAGANSAETTFTFGPARGVPLAADFNGDGLAELCVFDRGQWYIDLDGDHSWSGHDLLVRLGQAGDRPVVGDWDGDGKSDAGVFSLGGGADRALVLADAGLPDPMNQVTTDASRAHLAPLPGRQFVLHRTALSAPRRETIDHVLQFGSAGDLPVAGDWNGSGITKIGVFRGGRWTLDQNGDGRFGSEDPTHSFGPHDSLPLAGDFDGDGVFELAVFRDGWWRVDVDGDHSSGDGDLVVQFGAPSGTPLVADIDGDGVHELGVFHAEQE